MGFGLHGVLELIPQGYEGTVVKFWGELKVIYGLVPLTSVIQGSAVIIFVKYSFFQLISQKFSM